jgi:hypothetical protein
MPQRYDCTVDGLSVQERARVGSLGETILRASLKSYVEAQAAGTTNADQGKSTT